MSAPRILWLGLLSIAFTLEAGGAVDDPVKAPEEEHTVSVGKVIPWLDGGARSPDEKESVEGAVEDMTAFR